MKQIIDIKELTIDYIMTKVNEKSCFYILNPQGELFQHPETETAPENSLAVDMQSANLIAKIYTALSDSNKTKFNSVLQDEYKLASFLDEMWSFVQTPVVKSGKIAKTPVAKVGQDRKNSRR